MKLDYTMYCPGCGKSFTPNHILQIWCSRKCYTKHYKPVRETPSQRWERHQRLANQRHEHIRNSDRMREAIANAQLFPATFIAFDELVKRTLK